jgi:hypothetical protein
MQVKQQYPNLVMVDYTLPDVIHDMANLYIKHKTPFVMGVSDTAVDDLSPGAVCVCCHSCNCQHLSSRC